MSRSRKIHTDISTEIKLNRVSEFAALLYSWGIPHARDDCRLPKRDPEELRLLIFPGRNRTAADMESALAELKAEVLIGIDEDGYYFYPDEVFYKYQSYINGKNRRETPKLNKITHAENSREQQRSARIAKEVQGLPENSASPSPSPSPSLRKNPAKNAGAVDNLTSSDSGSASEELVNLAVQIGRRDSVATRQATTQTLCQWVISMMHCLQREPIERTTAVVRLSLEAVSERIDKGEPIHVLWRYLDTIFDRQRTAYMQGPENEAYKKMPVPEAMRDILKRIGNA